MVLAWLQRSLIGSITRSIMWINSASSVWLNLKIKFSQRNIFWIFDIKEDSISFTKVQKRYQITSPRWKFFGMNWSITDQSHTVHVRFNEAAMLSYLCILIRLRIMLFDSSRFLMKNSMPLGHKLDHDSLTCHWHSLLYDNLARKRIFFSYWSAYYWHAWHFFNHCHFYG